MLRYIGFIQCSKLKYWDRFILTKKENIPQRLPAKVAYSSTAFRLSVKICEKLNIPYMILSAVKGFLYPDEEIEYYENKTPEVEDYVKSGLETLYKVQKFETGIVFGSLKFYRAIARIFQNFENIKLIPVWRFDTYFSYLKKLKFLYENCNSVEDLIEMLNRI